MRTSPRRCAARAADSARPRGGPRGDTLGVPDCPRVLEAVPHVRRWLGELLAGWRLSEPDAADLALAVTEVCTNIARHGYRDAAGDIEVHVARDAGGVHVTILDQA